MVDFIETYNDALSAEFCAALISRFEASERQRPGATGHGVDKKKKDSVDINISQWPEWADAHARIVDVTYAHLVQYVRKYAYMLTGALVLSIPHPESGEMTPIDAALLERLNDRSVELLVRHMYRLGTINLQRYRAGEGGYHHWHSENYPQANDPQCEALHRALLFMYYLNDVADGGETDFLYQERSLRPQCGQLVFAPSGFTHTHKGSVPRSNDKYILTSWVLFQPAARLFGAPGR